jgi:hypothetical protein
VTHELPEQAVPSGLRCDGCRAKLTAAEAVRAGRWLQLLKPKSPLLCWVCLHLAAGNAKEAAELEKQYLRDEGIF